MPFAYAVGTSLVVVTALGLTTATSYALSGHVDWLLTALLIAGGVGGAALGILLGRKLAAHKMLFERAFALLVITVGISIALGAACDASRGLHSSGRTRMNDPGENSEGVGCHNGKVARGRT